MQTSASLFADGVLFASLRDHSLFASVWRAMKAGVKFAHEAEAHREEQGEWPALLDDSHVKVESMEILTGCVLFFKSRVFFVFLGLPPRMLLCKRCAPTRF